MDLIWQHITFSSVVGSKQSSFRVLKTETETNKYYGKKWLGASSIQYSFLNHGDTIKSNKYCKEINETTWDMFGVSKQKISTFLTWKRTTTHDTFDYAKNKRCESWMKENIHHINRTSTTYRLLLLQKSRLLLIEKILQKPKCCWKYFPRIC